MGCLRVGQAHARGMWHDNMLGTHISHTFLGHQTFAQVGHITVFKRYLSPYKGQGSDSDNQQKAERRLFVLSYGLSMYEYVRES